MKKFQFWLLTDVVWQFLFIMISLQLLIKYFHAVEYGHGGGDAGMVGIIAFAYFSIANIVFIIIHLVKSLAIISDFKLENFIKNKNQIFILQASFTFLLEISVEIYRYLNNVSTKLEWIFYFGVYILSCIFVYRFMTKALSQKMLIRNN